MVRWHYYRILLLSYIIMYYIVFDLIGFGYVCTSCTMFLFVKVFLGCPGIAINISVQYNGGLLPDIILLTQCRTTPGEPV